MKRKRLDPILENFWGLSQRHLLILLELQCWVILRQYKINLASLQVQPSSNWVISNIIGISEVSNYAKFMDFGTQ